MLVVEDERKIGCYIQKGLEEQGFAVHVVADGNDALVYATTEPYDAMVLDVMLPGRDGLSVLKIIREKRMPLPVLLLTARSALNERVEGLNMGADDYLPKPFHMEELVARVHSIVRRRSPERASIMQVADLKLNLLTREVSRGGKEISLSPREFSLLEYLMRSPGRVLTRTQIHEHVWNYHFDPETNVIGVYVGRIRQKVDEGFDVNLIETVRGIGYRVRKLS